MSIEKSDMIDTISTKRTTGEVIPTVNDYHDWSDTAGFRPRGGVPKVRKRLVVNADDFGFTPGRESRHRGRAPPRDSDRDNPDGQRIGLRRCRAPRARDTDARYRLPPGTDRRQFTRFGEALPPYRGATAGRVGAARNPAIRRVSRADTADRPTPASARRIWIPTSTPTSRRRCWTRSRALSREFGIRWVRQPFDFPLNALRVGVPRLKRMTSDALGLMRPPLSSRTGAATDAGRPIISPGSRSPDGCTLRNWCNCSPSFRTAARN